MLNWHTRNGINSIIFILLSGSDSVPDAGVPAARGGGGAAPRRGRALHTAAAVRGGGGAVCGGRLLVSRCWHYC